MLRYVVIAILCAGPATASCFADYKAKQNDPLRLHYGIAEVSDCTVETAASELAPRLQGAGWILLQVESVFETTPEEKKSRAGDYYLRF